MHKPYYNEEEQYAKSEKNEDLQLEKIKQKYSDQKIRVFHDEANFSDEHFLEIWDELTKKEQEEIDHYLQKKGEHNESIK